MYYLWNDKNEFCGESCISQEKSTTSKPLDCAAEKIIWDGSKWIYKYENFPSKFKLDTIYDLPEISTISLIVSKCVFNSGTEDRDFDGKVTILIPCYGKARHIVDVVKTCVNQTFPVKTMVLLMDSESHAKKEELEQLGDVTCIISEKKIVTQARTFLVDNCPTDWFVFLDADDFLDEHFVEILSKQKGAARFGSSVVDKEQGGFAFDKTNPKALNNMLCNNNTGLIHKDVFYDIGYNDNFCNGGEDSDFTIRLLDKEKWLITYTPETYYLYNTDTDNKLTHDFEPFRKSVYESYKSNMHIFEKRLKRSGSFDVSIPIDLVKNYSLDNLLSCYLYHSNQNLKKVFDRFISNVYYSLLNESMNSDKEIYFFNSQPVRSLEDIEIIAKNIDNPQNKNSIDNLFETLKTKRCFEKKLLKKNNEMIDLQNPNVLLNKIQDINYNDDINYIKNVIGKVLDIDKKRKQIVSFVFNKTCNANCFYCIQKDVDKKVYDEKVLFQNFDKAITKLEKMTGNNIYPQILGGEPTLFSDWLILKIIKRLEKYDRFSLFTNGIVKESAWDKASNINKIIHIINWHNTVIDEYSDRNSYNIVVTNRDMKYVKDFWDKNLDKFIFLNPCEDNNHEPALSLENVNIIGELMSNKYKSKNYYIMSKMKDYDDFRKACYQSSGVWSCDVGELTLAYCCGASEKQDFENWNPENQKKHCSSCFAFGNMID